MVLELAEQFTTLRDGQPAETADPDRLDGEELGTGS
jgi:hypothetical protein